jgi:hypothetical protein
MTADEFNETYRAGTPVDVRQDDGSILSTKTRSIAWDCCGTDVVMVEGIRGGYELSRVTPVVVKP